MDALAALQKVSREQGADDRIVAAMADAAAILSDGIAEVERAVRASATGAPARVEECCRHILEAGGKRIRPAICLLAFRAVETTHPLPTDLAVACELLHNSTLLHDDVIDEGQVRRGRPAARVVYGNAISILAGDYLLTRTVETVAAQGSEFMPEFVKTLRLLVEGEVTQLRLRGSILTTTDEYFEIIEGKTASLFRWAAYAGALAADAPESTCHALGRFGWHVGIAFQLIDDVLDLSADAAALGKSLLADIGQGKLTLPVILTRAESPELGQLLTAIADGGEGEDLAPQVADLVRRAGTLGRVRAQAAEHTRLARAALAELRDGNDEVIGLLSELAQALLERDR